ncbi:enoyl-CoA hydratase [Marinospirillum celere]|uniref:Enoyl-CoA hydratase n=1 Tax=Marinospirillum celere TaxID=1122252 RepID=A0A1I1EI60_9GAMM|nr:enoyl-CoA hydratase/isomerase family protein [Marinospirillum celere]SFB85098.1 enoyl-CoA hydratase [Marinospirillum celere]
MNYDQQPVLAEMKDEVLWLTLNRPERLNAVNQAVYTALCEQLDAARERSDVRALVLTGAGRAFCVGADMKAHAEGTRTAYEKREYLRGEQEVCRRLVEYPKPIVAAVNGYALGAGAELAVAADFLLMKSDALWGLPETSIGAFIGGGISWLLPQRVGMTQAKELVLLGEKITGDQAVHLGLAHRSLVAEGLDSFHQQVQEFARRLAKQAPLSMALAKQQLNLAGQRSLTDALTAELEGMMFCSSTEDWQEGVNAFTEKRNPVFSGR